MPSYQSVDVTVVDDTPSGDPVEGMLVRVFGTSGDFHTQDTTDADGNVGFTLWSQDYDLRFYKFGAQVSQPQRITVSETEANEFNVLATVFEPPLSNDPRLCRCSGYFRDITGAPHKNVDIHLIGGFNPILLEDSAVLSERRTVRTDEDGYVCVDLIRGACYEATVQGFEDTQRWVLVPDQLSASLPHMLFPIVAEVTFDPVGPYALAVGGTLELTPTVLTSSGVPLEGTAQQDVIWSSSDGAVFSVAVGQTTLTLTGVGPGTADLEVVRQDNSIVHIPLTVIQGSPQEVTVT
jgi:hypothetical protein